MFFCSIEQKLELLVCFWVALSSEDDKSYLRKVIFPADVFPTKLGDVPPSVRSKGLLSPNDGSADEHADRSYCQTQTQQTLNTVNTFYVANLAYVHSQVSDWFDVMSLTIKTRHNSSAAFKNKDDGSVSLSPTSPLSWTGWKQQKHVSDVTGHTGVQSPRWRGGGPQSFKGSSDNSPACSSSQVSTAPPHLTADI